MKTEPAKPDEERIYLSSAKPASPKGAVLVGAQSPARGPNETATSFSRKPRLLLVDDNKINLRMLYTFVRKKGFDETLVNLAEDGALAFDIFKTMTYKGRAPDIVFMDISMPVLNGYEATRAIRQFEGRRISEEGQERKPSRALIIAITGNTGDNDQSDAFACGMDMYMTKPVSFKEVGRLLENWREG